MVIGASGFIGRWVASYLTAAGAELTSVVRNPATFEAIRERWTIGGRVMQADLRSEHSAGNVVGAGRPDIVFNLAGYGVDPGEREAGAAWSLNARTPSLLLSALASIPADPAWAGCRLVHVGSALEYGSERGTLEEDGPATPTTLYGRSKLCGTLRLARAAHRQRLGAVTARLFTVYGPGEHPGRLLPELIRVGAAGLVLPLSHGLQRRDFTWVGDVATALLRLGITGGINGERVNVATGELVTVREFTEIAAHVLRIPRSHLLFGVRPGREEEMDHQPVSVMRLRHLIGWTPGTSIAEGIRRTADFHGPGTSRPA